MGYAKDGIQDALGKDKPNSMKKAYLIVIIQTSRK